MNLEENSKKIPLWAIKIVEAAQDFVAPSRTIKESKRPKIFSCYTINMSDLSKIEPTNPSNVIKHIAWKEAMIEEYQSIMKMMFEKLFQDLKEKKIFVPNGYLK